MKKILILILSLTIYSCDDSINDSNRRNENWCWWVDSKTGKGQWIPIQDETTVDDGVFTNFYFNGSIREIGRLKNKIDVDTLKLHDLNGKLVRYKIYKKDTTLNYFIYNGRYMYFYPNGNKLCEGIVTNHQRGDYWTQYFENGKIDFSEKYKNNQGTTVWYYESGQIKDSCSYLNHHLHGLMKKYYSNGVISFYGNFVNGKLNGEYRSCFENGNLRKRYHYKNGLRDSICVWYYKNGQLDTKCYFKNDIENGHCIAYYENSKIKSEGNFKNGKEEGLVLNYFESGQLDSKANYSGGKNNGELWFYHPNGKLKMYAKATMDVTTYYKTYDINGKPEVEYKDGNKIVY